MDISGNDFENLDNEIFEETEDVSGNDFNPTFEYDGDPYVSEPQTATLESSVDYSAHFENIETLFKFQIAVVIGLVLCVCFIVGWKND